MASAAGSSLEAGRRALLNYSSLSIGVKYGMAPIEVSDDSKNQEIDLIF